MLKAIDVLPYHTMGKAKYEQLGLEYPLGDTPALSKAEAVKARETILRGLREDLRRKKQTSAD